MGQLYSKVFLASAGCPNFWTHAASYSSSHAHSAAYLRFCKGQWTMVKRRRRREGWMRGLPSRWSRGPLPEKFFNFLNEMACSDALCMEHCFRANVHATEFFASDVHHCIRRVLIKIMVCDAECPPPQYTTALTHLCAICHDIRSRDEELIMMMMIMSMGVNHGGTGGIIRPQNLDWGR